MISAIVMVLTCYLALDCSAAYGARTGDDGRGPRQQARLQDREIADELPRAVLPGAFQRKGTAGLARHGQRTQTGGAQIVVQRTDRMIGDHVERAGDGECRNRRTAGKRLELHDAEGIGEARKYEHVGGGDMRGQVLAGLFAEEFYRRESALELR